jgi:hypothetical protein
MKTLLNLTGDFYLPADLAVLDDVMQVLEPDAPFDLGDVAAVAALAEYADMLNLIVLLPDATAVAVVQHALPRAEIVTL